MITVTSAQLDAWIGALLFPLVRIMALMSTAPVFNNAGMPRRVRLFAGLAVTIAILPALPPMPPVPAGSWTAIHIVAQQVLIGVLMGFTLRVAFAAIDLAGEMIGLQMGLSFAVFYDPQNSGQTPVVAEFFSLLATLIYLALNGHLLSLALLARSFELLPVSTQPFAGMGFTALFTWTATIFSAGVLLSLPLIAALLIANIAMGVLSRVAPQLNLFAIGFPVTLVAGFVVIGVSLPYFAAALERLFDLAFTAMMTLVKAGAGG